MNQSEHGKKIIIGIPSGSTVQTNFAMSLVSLCNFAIMMGIQVGVVNQQSAIIEVGRNKIVAQAKRMKADYLLCLDSDMVFPHTLLTDLIAHDKDVVCCDYARRKPPFDTILIGMNGKPLKHGKKSKGLTEIMGSTSGCTLFKMEVFEKLVQPYYAVTWEDPTNSTSEDYYLSNKFARANIRMWCDMTLSKRIGHIGARTHFIGGA